MNEKIKKVGITAKEKVTEFAKKNPELVTTGLVIGGMLFTYIIGEKVGQIEVARVMGGALSIYPKDATVSQFLEDFSKL